GILDTVQTKLPNTFHAHCVLHIEEFDEIMKEISNLNKEASIYLSEILSAIWTLSKCSRSRFSHLISNTSKSLNFWLCEKHLVEPFDTIILFVHRINTLYYNHHSSIQAMLPPTTAQQLQSVINYCCNRIVYQVNKSVFEVKSNNAILKACKQPSQFVHTTYYTTTLQNVYKESVHSVNVEMCCFDNKTLPPASIKQAG
ncbi:35617_t:CDS:2, partial [Gigaspora margarita]